MVPGAGLGAVFNQANLDPRSEAINYRAMELYMALLEAHLPPNVALKVAQDAVQRNAQADVANAGAAAAPPQPAGAPRPAGVPPQPGARPAGGHGPNVAAFLARYINAGAEGSAERATWNQAFNQAYALDNQQAPKEREEKVNQEVERIRELRPPKRLAPIPEEIVRAGRLTDQSLGQMNQYLDDSRMMSGRGAQTFPRNVAQYMNPYQQQVVDKIREEGLRTLREGALPALEAQFIRRGAHGGTQHRELAERAARDIQGEILSRQAKTMHEGYGEAAKNFNSDQLRTLQHGQDISRLGGMKLAGNAADIAGLMDIGRYKQGHAQHGKENEYIDYMNQINRPFDLLDRLGGFLGKFPTSTSQTQITSNPGPSYLNSAGQAGSLAGQVLGMMRKGGGRTPYKSQIKRRRRR